MSLKSALLNLFFPLACLNCGQSGAWLCPRCRRLLKINDAGRSKARLTIPHLDDIFIAGDYSDPLLAALIKKFKYGFIKGLGEELSRFLIFFWAGAEAGFGKTFKEPPDFLVVPLPLTAKRRRWRGFNQAEILARPFAHHFAYAFGQDLERTAHRPPQTALNEKERTLNVKGAFAWRGGDLRDKKIILVDDVVTTGATLNEAASVLRAAGASRIYGLVLAKG